MSAADMTCPHCQASMRGEPIPDEHRRHKPDHDEQVTRYGRCFCLPYGEDVTHFSRAIGHEIPGVYDGVLFWSCPECFKAWPRFTDRVGRLSFVGADYALQHNEAVAS